LERKIMGKKRKKIKKEMLKINLNANLLAQLA